jgi:uncharacterized membrane protein
MAMEPAVKLVRQVRIAMLVSIALFTIAGEILVHRMNRYPADTLFHALSFISISLVGATVVIRRTLVQPSEIRLRERPDDRVAVARWRDCYLFLYALCTLLGVFGLVLRIDSFTLANVWGFYLGGFLLLLLYSPGTLGAKTR